MSDGVETDVGADAAQLLRSLDQDRFNRLLAAFNHAAMSINATNTEAMWGVAMLQAQVLARGEFGAEQTWVARMFGELVRIALPGAMMQAEVVKRANGRHPDA